MEQLKERAFWSVLRKRWIVVFLFPIMFALCSIALSLYVLKPKYAVDTSLLVNENSPTLSSIQYDSILANQALVQTYQSIVKSSVLEQSVINSLHLPYTVVQLDSMIHITSPLQSQILDIRVVAPSEALAVEIANRLAQDFRTRAQSLMRTQTIQIVDPAVAPSRTKPVQPHKILNTLVGFLIGLFFGIGLAFLLESFDNRLHTEQDVEQATGYPVFGTIFDYVPQTEGK